MELYKLDSYDLVGNFHQKQDLDLHGVPADAELIDLLIKYQNNRYGSPPLHAAIRDHDERAVRLFLEHGADPNAIGGGTGGHFMLPPSFALDHAAAFGTPEIVNLLIDHGASIIHEEIVNGVLVKQPSPIFFAAAHNNVETMKALVSRGSSLLEEGCSNFAGTPLLHVAAAYGSSDAVSYLISSGLDPNMLTRYGSPPLYCVFLNYYGSVDRYAVAEVLLKAGANPNLKLNGHQPSLHILASQSNNEWYAKNPEKLAELLIRYGADVNAEDFYGHTPLWHARNAGATRLFAVLEAHGAKAK